MLWSVLLFFYVTSLSWILNIRIHASKMMQAIGIFILKADSFRISSLRKKIKSKEIKKDKIKKH